MKKSLQYFYAFLKNPQPLKFSCNSKELVKDFFSIILLNFSFALLLIIALSWFAHFNLVNVYEGPDLLNEFGIIGMFIFACIFAPISEELIFRWQLKDINGAIYFVSLSIATILLSFLNNSWTKFAIIIIALIVAATVISLLRKKNHFTVIRVWKKAYPYLFYYTAMMFGLLHLSNYNGLSVADPSFVFYIGSQAFGALGLGYIRIKHGFIYAILLHALFNFTCFFIIAIAH
jgi:membrane protease YdiL (CAAX protease family)